jgi:hypothetical protein
MTALSTKFKLVEDYRKALSKDIFEVEQFEFLTIDC